MNSKEAIIPAGMEAGHCYSHAIRHGDILYVSGQVGKDSNGHIPADIQGQTELAILNAKRLIEAAGGSLDNVLMCRCFLQKKEDFNGMNEAYAKFFGGEHNTAPARYTVVAPPVDDIYLVEIVMIVGL